MIVKFLASFGWFDCSGLVLRVLSGIIDSSGFLEWLYSGKGCVKWKGSTMVFNGQIPQSYNGFRCFLWLDQRQVISWGHILRVKPQKAQWTLIYLYNKPFKWTQTTVLAIPKELLGPVCSWKKPTSIWVDPHELGALNGRAFVLCFIGFVVSDPPLSRFSVTFWGGDVLGGWNGVEKSHRRSKHSSSKAPAGSSWWVISNKMGWKPVVGGS